MKHKKGFVIYIFLVVAYTPDAQAGLVQCVTVRGTSLRRVRVGAGVLVPERVRFFVLFEFLFIGVLFHGPNEVDMPCMQ